MKIRNRTPRGLLRWSGAAALATVTFLAGCGKSPEEPPAGRTPTEILARRVSADLPRTDPASTLWDRAPEHAAKMLLQDQTEPKLLAPGADIVRVRALHDDRFLVLRLEWTDATRDTTVSTDIFSDAAAVEFPLRGGSDVPDAAMGQPGRPVRIHAWRASLQDRLEAAAGAVPGSGAPVADHYPFEAAAEKDREAMSLLYAPARASQNPVTVIRTDAPTEDLIAEGFGTLRTAAERVSTGRGLHADGNWRIVIARPLDQDAEAALLPGKRTFVALAVWDGSAKHVGARKMRSGWIPITLEPRP